MSNLGIDINIAFDKLKEAIGLTDKLNKQLASINSSKTNVAFNTSAFDRAWSKIAMPPSSAAERLAAQGYSLSRTPVNAKEIAAWEAAQGGGAAASAKWGAGKLLGFGAAAGTAAMGLGGIFNFIGESRDKFRQDAISRALLAQRGVTGIGAAMGYGSIEAQQIASQLAAGTGYQGAGARLATRSLMDFSRATGTDAGFGASLMSGWRDSLNANPERQKKTLELLTIIAKNTGDSVERVSRVLNANYGLVTTQQAGMELSPLQQARMSALTETLYNSLGAMGRNPAIMRSIMNVFRPTGDRFTDIGKIMATGVNEGTGGFDTLVNMRRIAAEGATTKEGRERYRRMIDSYRDSTGMMDMDKLTYVLQSVFPESMGFSYSAGGNMARNVLNQLLMSGKLEGTLQQRENTIYNAFTGAGLDKEQSGYMSKKAAQFLSTTGGSILTQQAAEERARIAMGEKLHTAVFSMERAVTKLELGLLKSNFAEKTAKAAQQFSSIVEKLTDKAVNAMPYKSNLITDKREVGFFTSKGLDLPNIEKSQAIASKYNLTMPEYMEYSNKVERQKTFNPVFAEAVARDISSNRDPNAPNGSWSKDIRDLVSAIRDLIAANGRRTAASHE